MKKSRFSEEKIISVLKQAEAGMKVSELVRKHGISEATFYNWKASTVAWTSRSCGGSRNSSPRMPG
jgi:putative transposase